ncbi:AAA family ATPase [Virgibacillus soli]|uniref:AAA family ATPase n=1 Tax=Paracerasibacillus soli TaxID=480284 RepID=A0ABU5CW79_9BACI|nr:AAA family ATPase [Virgibacillus soli]MDY0410629.1 AAA family ATPase [Virgibacillus soli]
MLRPDEIKEYHNPDLKLGIKSSLPRVKSTLGLFFMLWKASDKNCEITYSQIDGDSTILIEDLKSKLIDIFAPIYESYGVSDDEFIDKVNENQMFKSQLESLIVAFELIWRVGKIKFFDDRPASSERTGRKRYPKTIAFTKNMDIIDTILMSNQIEYSKVLLAWIGLDIDVNSENESSLLKLLVHLSEEAVYKLVDEDKDVIFNMNSVYIKLLENENSIIDINGSKEPKGSLRILKSLLSDGMNPYINYSNTRGLELADGMKEELELYQCRVDASLSLLNTKYIVDQIDDKNESTYTIEVSEENELYSSRISGGNNILLYGVPGSGKSYKIEEEYCNDFNFMERVVFHPDYMNTDFVGQILPTVKGEGDEKEITYDFTPGPFTRVLKKAIENPRDPYYLVIEEINRGNAPAIFGEIFQLLDRDADGKSSYEITNYNIANEVFDEKEKPIYLPSNLHILATMNTADQNVFTLDTAFQRRWDMKMIENDVSKAEHASKSILDTNVTWERFNTVINDQIITSSAATLSSEDKRLGAYFVTEEVLKFYSKEENLDDVIQKYSINDRDADKIDKAIKDLNSRFGDKVIKYLWDDAFKFSRDELFDVEYKSLEKILDTFNYSVSDERFNVFNQDIKENLFRTLDTEDSEDE